LLLIVLIEISARQHAGERPNPLPHYRRFAEQIAEVQATAHDGVVQLKDRLYGRQARIIGVDLIEPRITRRQEDEGYNDPAVATNMFYI
jgi:hypothetical protein